MRYKYKIALSLVLLFFTYFALSQNENKTGNCPVLDLLWVRTGGGAVNDEALAVATDSEGNIYATGFFSNQMNIQGIQVLGQGGKDLFVVKLNSDGDVQWINKAVGDNEVFGTGIAVDNQNNIYVTGTFNGSVEFNGEIINSQDSDVFLIKYNSEGEYLWGQFFGGFNADVSGGITIDNNGNPIIIGTFFNSIFIDGTTLLSNGGQDFFLAKFNPDGNLIWAANDASDSDDFGRKVAVDNANNVYITGDFAGEIVFGTQTVQANGVFDVFVAKYSSEGNPQWIQTVGSNGNVDRAGDIDTDNLGNIFVCLYVDQPGPRGKLQKISTNGDVITSFTFGNNSTQPRGIKITSSGYIYMTGEFSGVVDFGDGDASAVGGKDVFIVKYDSDGQLIDKYLAGSSDDDAGYAIDLDSDNNVVIAGFCNNAIYFDGNPYFSQGMKDLLIVKFERYFSFGQITISSIGCDENNMCIDVEMHGGTPSFSFDWSSGHTDENICGLSTGEYSVTVTDDEGCLVETSIVVEPPQPPEFSLPPLINICPHESGTIDAGDGFVNYLWNTGETEQILEVDNAGTFSVTVTDQNQCTAEASVNVSVIPAPNLLVNDEEYICPGESITFSLQGFDEYLWSDGSTNATYLTYDQGLHWVRVYDGTCYFYDTIMIILYPEPHVDIGDDVLICPGDTAFFDAGEGFSRYIWHDESEGQFYFTTTDELVYVQVTDSNGCEAEDAAIVTTADMPYVNLGQDTVICKDPNEAFILHPNDTGGDNTYLWSNGSTEQSIYAYSTGNYWVEVTNNLGCTNFDSVFLQFFPAISVDLGPNVEFCEGEYFTFAIPNDYDIYIWHDNSSDTSYTAFHTGVVSVTVTDANGCYATDSAYVYEHVMPDPDLGEDQILCDGTSTVLFTSHSYQKYVWQDGSTSDEFFVDQPGQYSLTVTNSFGCSKTTSVNITYVENPVIDQANLTPGYVEIIVSNGAPPYSYTHNNTQSWQQTHTFHQLPVGEYIFYVRDDNHCKDSVELIIEAVIEIPSFFTPNNDGYNDYWEIQGIFNFPTAEIQIFDRFGKKLAEFNGTNMKWNGTYNGQRLPSDTYWYVIRLEDGANPITGSVTLKR